MKGKAFVFHAGLILGVLLGVLSAFALPKAQAQKPTQLDIMYNVLTQNFYLTQKLVAYNEFNRQMTLLLADQNKIKTEQVVPLTNKLQQDLFALDLKIRELNK